MTLEEAVALIEARWPVKAGLPTNICQTGEPYDCVVIGGIKPEDRRYPLLATSADVAVEAWLQSFNEYAAGKRGTLYWRCRPEIECTRFRAAGVGPRTRKSIKDILTIDLYRIHCRLIITEEPELSERDLRVTSAHMRRLAAA